MTHLVILISPISNQNLLQEKTSDEYFLQLTTFHGNDILGRRKVKQRSHSIYLNAAATYRSRILFESSFTPLVFIPITVKTYHYVAVIISGNYIRFFSGSYRIACLETENWTLNSSFLCEVTSFGMPQRSLPNLLPLDNHFVEGNW